MYNDDDERSDIDIPFGEDFVNADLFPADFDTDDLPEGWTTWTWDDLFLWLEDYYDIPEGDGGYGSGGLNAG